MVKYFLSIFFYYLFLLNLTSTTEVSAKDQAKRLWNGLGSFFSSVKQKTLDIVDNLQDQIIDLDDKLHQPEQPPDDQVNPSKPQKEFDKKLLPILENASTYIDEPTQVEYQEYSKTFSVEDHKEDIELFTENSPNLRRIHSRLVPSAFSEEIFWCRLFFKLEMKEKAKKVSEELKIHLSAENSPIKISKNLEETPPDDNDNDSIEEVKEDNNINSNKENVDTNNKSNISPEDIELTPEELEELDKLGSDEDWHDWE